MLALLTLAFLAQVPPAGSAPPVEMTVPDEAADMQEFFSLMDGDGDQVVTRAEYDGFFAKAAAQAGGTEASAKQGMAEFFAMMDANGDARITKAEFDAFEAQASAAEGSGD
jgi:Ca2+-binding EF-hand superfamily protein